MGPLDRLWIWRARSACEIALLCSGGEELLTDARTEAAWYADLHHPTVGTDGTDGTPTDGESAARVNAWISILVARARVASAPRRRVG